MKKQKALLWLLTLTTLTGCLSTPLSPASHFGTWNTSPEELLPYVYTSRRAPVEPKSYTIMVYLNGSDLETDHQAAAADLLEMMQSGFDQEEVNVIVFTGGTRRWHLGFIPNRKNAIFQLEQDAMTRLLSAGKSPMGDPVVLAGFINFCTAYYPAEQYGLILWNHGGGTIQGFGHDERYEDDPGRAMMKLRDMERAFSASVPAGGLAFLGFDTCLMATLEMAAVAQPYARYLIASQDLEPADGWDYSFLGHIRPGDTGADIGLDIIRYYEAFYRESSLDHLLTLSLVDLAKLKPLYNAFENLARGTAYALSNGAFHRVSKARANTRTFGGEEGDGTDMVDLAQLAQELSPLSPREAGALLEALDEAVLYQYNDYPGELGGLSVYFPFANKRELDHSIAVYKNLEQLPYYTRLVSRFAHKLQAPPPEGEAAEIALIRSTTWIGPKALGLDAPEDYLIKLLGESAGDFSPFTLEGHLVSAYEVTRNPQRARYAIPIRLNGKEARLLAVCKTGESKGQVIGAVPIGDDVFNRMDKKVAPLRPGDTITPLYPALPAAAICEISPPEPLWLPGPDFSIEEPLQIERTPASNLRYFWELVDVQGNRRYAEAEELSQNN